MYPPKSLFNRVIICLLLHYSYITLQLPYITLHYNYPSLKTVPYNNLKVSLNKHN